MLKRFDNNIKLLNSVTFRLKQFLIKCFQNEALITKTYWFTFKHITLCIEFEQ